MHTGVYVSCNPQFIIMFLVLMMSCTWNLEGTQLGTRGQGNVESRMSTFPRIMARTSTKLGQISGIAWRGIRPSGKQSGGRMSVERSQREDFL